MVAGMRRLEPQTISARLLAFTAVVALALAGCTSQDSPDSGGPSANDDAAATEKGSGPAEPALTNEDAVAEAAISMGGVEMTATVRPLVRTGALVVATIDLNGLPADESVSTMFFSTSILSAPPLVGIRLFDLVKDEVYSVATDEEQKKVSTYTDSNIYTGNEPRLQMAFAAPDEATTSLGLFLPGAKYISTVPIIDGDVPPPRDEHEDFPFDVTRVKEAPVFALESFTSELSGAVETLTSTEVVQVTLGADVLFKTDEDTLTQDAAAVVKEAAKHLNSREPGTIEIVGHTDNVASRSYNQKLSERRAKAVAVELEKHVSGTDFPMETSGKGKTEPFVPNSNDANRALNRRVTLTLKSEITTTTEVESADDLPELEGGQTAMGPEGVTISSSRIFHYRVPQARMIDGHIVVDLEVTATDGEVDSSFGIGSLSGVWSYRGDGTSIPHRSSSGLKVLDGSTVVAPLDYQYGTTDSGNEIWLPAADVETHGRQDGGQTRVYSVIYPRLGTPDTITVQVSGGISTTPFRLTHIPVVAESD